MLIITTSERVEEVVHNIIKEKTWDLWVTGIIVVDKDMVGQQINDIPVLQIVILCLNMRSVRL